MIQRHVQDVPNILLIENDAGNRMLAERILALSGYGCVAVSNGQEALRLLDQQHFDLILTDLSMPVLDGFRMAMLIRARPELAQIPIVALTAHAFEAERQQALRMGCTDLLVKPYRPKELLAMVARYLPGATQ